jgi:hypothetical protein
MAAAPSWRRPPNRPPGAPLCAGLCRRVIDGIVRPRGRDPRGEAVLLRWEAWR